MFVVLEESVNLAGNQRHIQHHDVMTALLVNKQHADEHEVKLGKKGACEDFISLQQSQDWGAQGSPEDKHSHNNLLRFANMLRVHAGARAATLSGPDSSRLAPTASSPPEGKRYRSLGETARIYKFPPLGGKSNHRSPNS